MRAEVHLSNVDFELVMLRSAENIADPDLLFGAQLINRLGCPVRSEFQKRRVLARLRAAPAHGFASRKPVLRLGLAIVFVAAASSAAVAAYLGNSASKQEIGSAPPVSAAAAQPVVKPKFKDAVRETPPEELAAAPQTTVEPAQRAKSKRPSAASRSTSLTTRAQEEADARLLLEAMRSRQSGDSERVTALVEEYRRKQPSGALQEEALTLAIESAMARHDPDAVGLAREYLARYPNGRFKAQAKRALSSEAR